MTITKKPHATEAKATSPAIPETDIQALIQKGGSVAQKGGGENSPDNKPQLIQLRLDRDFLTRIDSILHQRKVKIPRHTWILEALYEKLEREGEATK